jgi:hypothetical protein
MPTLAKKWFKQKNELTPETAKVLSTYSFGVGATDTLVNLGWDGNLIASVGLELTPDNRRVARSMLLLKGTFTKEPVSIAANKLFPDADKNTMLSITLPQGHEFRFANGTTASDLLPCESFKHHYVKDQQIIFPTDWAANKVGETCMRAIVHLDKDSNASGPKPKATILLFPKSAEEMTQLSDSTKSPAWPGIRIIQQSGTFFPQLPQWSDPICPVLFLGTLYDAAPNLPSLEDIRFNIAAVMRSARLPTACATNAGLTRQWNKALSDVDRLDKDPTITWPEAPRPAVPAGELPLFTN